MSAKPKIEMNSTHSQPSSRAIKSTVKSKGFTLVELLVVITIIAVLAGIAFSVSRGVMRSASASTTTNNLRQLVVLCQTYSADHNGEILTSQESPPPGGNPGDFAPRWPNHLLYTQFPELAESKYASMQPKADELARNIGIFSDPQAFKGAKSDLPDTGYLSWNTYAYNMMIGKASGKWGAARVANVEEPEKLVLFNLQTRTAGTFRWFMIRNGFKNGDVDFDTYKGKTPVAYFDGHVAMHTAGDYPLNKDPVWGAHDPVNSHHFGYSNPQGRKQP